MIRVLLQLQAGEIRDEDQLTVQVGVFLHLCHID